MIQILDKYGNTSTDDGRVIILDANGNVKKITSGSGPTGPAGGDLSGTYPNPSVVWANGQPTYDLVYYPLSTNPAGYLTSSALTPYLTTAAAALTYYPIPTGTVSQYIDGTGAFQTFPTITSGTVTSVAALTLGTTGTDLTSTVANPTTTPVITLNVPDASATARGALTSTDWNTFNNKQNALGFTPEDVANKQTDLTASATKYPTVDAVNTGLALKQNILSYTPYRNIQTSQTALTGTTVETLIFTATIPANAFSSTDVIKVLFGANKSTALGTYSLRLRVNTTNTISGAPTIALYNGTATAQVNVMMRNFNLNGGNLRGFMFATSGITDIAAVGGSLGSTPLNPANQFFIFATITLNNSGDSIIGNMLSIHN